MTSSAASIAQGVSSGGSVTIEFAPETWWNGASMTVASIRQPTNGHNSIQMWRNAVRHPERRGYSQSHWRKISRGAARPMKRISSASCSPVAPIAGLNGTPHDRCTICAKPPIHYMDISDRHVIERTLTCENGHKWQQTFGTSYTPRMNWDERAAPNGTRASYQEGEGL